MPTSTSLICCMTVKQVRASCASSMYYSKACLNWQVRLRTWRLCGINAFKLSGLSNQQLLRESHVSVSGHHSLGHVVQLSTRIRSASEAMVPRLLIPTMVAAASRLHAWCWVAGCQKMGRAGGVIVELVPETGAESQQADCKPGVVACGQAGGE